MKGHLRFLLLISAGCSTPVEELPVRLDGDLVHLALRNPETTEIELYDLVSQNWLEVRWEEDWSFGAVDGEGFIFYVDSRRGGVYRIVADGPDEETPGDNDELVETPGCDQLDSRGHRAPLFLTTPWGGLAYQCGGRWYLDGRELPSCEFDGWGHLIGVGVSGEVYCDSGVHAPDGSWHDYSGLPEVVYPNRPAPNARELGVYGARATSDGLFVLGAGRDARIYLARLDPEGIGEPVDATLASSSGAFESFFGTGDVGTLNFAGRTARWTAGGRLYVAGVSAVQPLSIEYRFYEYVDGVLVLMPTPDLADLHLALLHP